MDKSVTIGPYEIGGGNAPLLIAGPCVIESADGTLSLAEAIASLAAVGGFQLIFKASYSKDNRSSGTSFRGPGIDEGLAILQKVREQVGCPVLSDVHSPDEAAAAAEALDVVQIPAFLSRQTSLLEAVAKHAQAVNVKKGQFLAPEDMKNVVSKLEASGAKNVLVTERGTSFGYHDLVVDFRGLPKMREATGCPVIFDVTHSLQKPGGLGSHSGGEPELAGVMARAAAAVPVDGLFIETHPDPSQAMSDGASMVPLAKLESILSPALRVFEAVREGRSTQGVKK